jgi:CHAT domain-containing protein
MSGDPRIPALLHALQTAFAAQDSRGAADAIDALLPLTLTATDDRGIGTSLETLAYACQLGLVLGDPDQTEHFVTLFKGRLAGIGDPALIDTYRPMFTGLAADIAALRASGVARGDLVEAFFETAGQLLGAPVEGIRSPEAVEGLLRRVARLPPNEARIGLTTLVAMTDRIAEHRFRAGNRGEVVAWLDAVEPFIPLIEPAAAVQYAVGWSGLYRNSALHRDAEFVADDAMARFATMLDGIPPPAGADPATWAAHKASMRDQNEHCAALDRAMLLRNAEDMAPAAQAVLPGASAARLSPVQRQLLERLAAGMVPEPDDAEALPRDDVGYNMFRLTQALRPLQAGKPGEAAELLAALLPGAERDADLSWSVPLLLSHCLVAVASHRSGLLPAATALLKQAVRQLERQKLEASVHAQGALPAAAVGPAAEAYALLRDSLLAQDRIGEAIRVDLLRVERECRLPAALDQSLRDLAAERLPAFPAERHHWDECNRSAARLRPGDGSRWLDWMAAQPPKLNPVQMTGLGAQRPSAGELSLGFVPTGDAILVVARDRDGGERHQRLPIHAIALNEAVLKLQMAIRGGDGAGEQSAVAAAEVMGAMLFDPLGDLLRNDAIRRLLIEPTGVIAHVPFGALRFDGAWLAERYEITLPGGWQMAANDDAAGDGIVSICVPQSGREVALRWVEKDREAIGAFAAATGMRLRTMPSAETGRDAVLDLLRQPPRMLHFSCHFKADILDMAQSAFLLAGTERLTVDALSRCPLRGCDLALLLGCETASRPPAAPGSAIVGVDAALLRLGVRSVVSSHWPVDDQASHLFLQALLAAVQRPGVSKAAAVRQAQMAVMQCGFAHFRHPVHWAAFALVGQG